MSDGLGYYTPQRLRWLLANWELVCCLAETPSSSRHHLDSQHRKPGPTPATPRTGARQRGYHGDALRWADVAADVELAHAHLVMWSLGWNVVDYRLRTRPGLPLGGIARALRIRTADVLAAYREALERMSQYLEGTGEEHGDTGGETTPATSGDPSSPPSSAQR